MACRRRDARTSAGPAVDAAPNTSAPNASGRITVVDRRAAARMPSPPGRPPTARAPAPETPPPARPAPSALLASAHASIVRAATSSGMPSLSAEIQTGTSIAVTVRITSSMVACSRTSQSSPKSRRTASPITGRSSRDRSTAAVVLDSAANPSPHASGAPGPTPLKTSYSTRKPRISHSTANPSGFAAPSTSHTTMPAYDRHGLKGVNLNRTARDPPGVPRPRASRTRNRARPSPLPIPPPAPRPAKHRGEHRHVLHHHLAFHRHPT